MTCPLIAKLENWRVLSKEEKASSSKTIIVFGEIDSSAVVIKLFDQRGAERRGLLKEVKLYRAVTNLLQQHWTPNVVRYVDYAVCSAASLRKLRIQLGPTVGLLATERIRGPPVYQAIRDQTLSANDLLSVIFQIVHAIGTLALAGIRHADLHSGNVLISQGPRSTVYKANLGKELYWSVPSKALAKIFDWDFGDLASDSARNPKAAETCKQFDTCNTNPKADLYTFLSSVWQKCRYRRKYTSIAELIERWIDPILLEAGQKDGLFEQRRGFQKRLCYGPIASQCPALITQKDCSGPWEPPDCLIATPGQMLADPVFSKWQTFEREAWGSDLMIE